MLRIVLVFIFILFALLFRLMLKSKFAFASVTAQNKGLAHRLHISYNMKR